MKEAVFNALTTVSTLAAIDLLAVGTNFFFGTAESKQANNTALRHKITYHTRITQDSEALAGQDSLTYARKLDILESDDTGDETKTDTRPGVERVAARDDDDRYGWKEGDWS